MLSLKLFLLQKTLRALFMDGVQFLLFNTRSLGLAGAHLSTSEGRMAGLNLEPPNCFQPRRTPGLAIQH